MWNTKIDSREKQMVNVNRTGNLVYSIKLTSGIGGERWMAGALGHWREAGTLVLDVINVGTK